MALRLRQVLAIAALPLAAGCAIGPGEAPPEPVTSRSLTDDYMMVQGMAAGALTADGVSEADYGVLVKLDRDAALALNSSASDPQSVGAKRLAQAAITRLAYYAEAVGAGAPRPAAAP